MSGIDHPWEESRGMGFSYGYNRAENAQHYRTGRELVLMLVDLVSRGGNLLLDIGPTPTADSRGDGGAAEGNGRLAEGQRRSHLRHACCGGNAAMERGRDPQGEYNKEFMTPYDVAKLTEKPAGGKASIDAFFTVKGSDSMPSCRGGRERNSRSKTWMAQS